MKTFLLIFVFCFGIVASASEVPDPPDASTQPAIKTTDAEGRVVWHFTSYLQGTTPQVIKLLNSEVERLRPLRASSLRDVTEQLKAIAPHQKKAVERLHQSAAYLDLAGQLQSAESEKQALEGEERAAVTKRIAKLHTSMQKLEHDTLWADPTLKDELTQVRAAEEELRHHTESLARAEDWRDKLVAVVQNALTFDYPPQAGVTGGLYAIYPSKVLPNKNVMADADLIEWTGQRRRSVGDEIVTETSIIHSLHFVLKGVTGAVVGKQLLVHSMFRITRITNTTADPEKGVYYAERVKDDADEVVAAAHFAPEVPKQTLPPLP